MFAPFVSLVYIVPFLTPSSAPPLATSILLLADLALPIAFVPTLPAPDRLHLRWSHFSPELPLLTPIPGVPTSPAPVSEEAAPVFLYGEIHNLIRRCHLLVLMIILTMATLVDGSTSTFSSRIGLPHFIRVCRHPVRQIIQREILGQEGRFPRRSFKISPLSIVPSHR